MGVLPLQFTAGQTAEALGLTGEETYSIHGLPPVLAADLAGSREVTVVARAADGKTTEFPALVRIDTPQEARYYEHGGILPFVLRQLLATKH
jgi:aconitate hydratase